MKGSAIATALLLTACGSAPADGGGEQAGRGLERAAMASGLVAPAGDPVGLYAGDTDRACVVAVGNGEYRFGATVDYGPDHRCRASGSARGATNLQVRLSGDCRFVARFDGERMVFPAILPAGCDRACTGRASLAAFAAERLSASTAEAMTMTDSEGKAMCVS